jgi:hypothetical protein
MKPAVNYLLNILRFPSNPRRKLAIHENLLNWQRNLNGALLILVDLQARMRVFRAPHNRSGDPLIWIAALKSC